MGKIIKSDKKKNSLRVSPRVEEMRSSYRMPADNTYVYKPSRSLVGTGVDKFKRKEYPEFHGHIIFCNGYLSSVTKNVGAQYNAIFDFSPDKNKWYVAKGSNADEKNLADGGDIYFPEENERDLPEAKRMNVEDIKKIMEKKTNTFSYADLDRYWGYWNDNSNRFHGSGTFAGYFNAQGNEYFINGSHGLGSAANHRIDHGIILGYHWAKTAWGILSKKEFYKVKNKYLKEFLKTYTPPYRPVTIVGHSQGCACAAGVVLGILNYANKMGWDSIPVNIIFLGVHQPVKLTGTEYGDFIDQKKNYYCVDRTLPTFMAKKAKNGKVFIDGLADLFNEDYNKLKQEKGIHEYLKEICGDWEAYKNRSVQFTFTNDRADTVTRDGDIPSIDSACDPSIDSTLFSIEIFSGKEDGRTAKYTTSQNKKLIAIKDIDGRSLGRLYLPAFLANRRIEFTDDGKEEIWENYESLAVSYATSFLRYCWVKDYYEKKYNTKYNPYEHLGPVEIVVEAVARGSVAMIFNELYAFTSKRTQIYFRGIVDSLYVKSLKDYAAIQSADLYAHFSPVGLITNEKILDDWNYSSDSLGIILNIWERIMKKGGDKFYRIDKNSKKDYLNRYIYQEVNPQKDNNDVERITTDFDKFIPTSMACSLKVKNIISERYRF